ncbi:MAG: pyridoxal-phosphate dependent enzyme [Bacteroidota bacterium]
MKTLFEEIINIDKAIEQEIVLPDYQNKVKVFIKRLDLIHPHISGNKWFKLKYNLHTASENGYNTLLTFGGTYSNHIYATSAAGKLFGFNTIGIIRGEEHLPLNSTLQFAADNGMQLHYVTRSDYRKKHTEEFQNSLREKFGNVYIVPEGGTNPLALKGVAEIPSLIQAELDYICAACGTAGTLSGLIAGLEGKKNLLGFSVLKGGNFLIDSAEKLVEEYTQKKFSNWTINLNYHFGGYAKINRTLIEFVKEFEKLNGIQLDYIYTGKMLYGIFDLLKSGYFKKNERIIALHTGGLQGNEGMIKRYQSIMKLSD